MNGREQFLQDGWSSSYSPQKVKKFFDCDPQLEILYIVTQCLYMKWKITGNNYTSCFISYLIEILRVILIYFLGIVRAV
jgi:hypothetical protein